MKPMATFYRHRLGWVRVVMAGSIADTDAGWEPERELHTEAELKEALEEVHQRMGLSLWTIYERPTDYPDMFVARRWHGSSVRHEPTMDLRIGETLDSVRQQLPGGLTNIGRKNGDEAQIVEVWV